MKNLREYLDCERKSDETQKHMGWTWKLCRKKKKKRDHFCYNSKTPPTPPQCDPCPSYFPGDAVRCENIWSVVILSHQLPADQSVPHRHVSESDRWQGAGRMVRQQEKHTHTHTQRSLIIKEVPAKWWHIEIFFTGLSPRIKSGVWGKDVEHIASTAVCHQPWATAHISR